ncbi:QueT transporter family protein [Streptococcus sp. 121]|uniref:QueT transporter family protein n=1 Tax=Streptococcus sp. 121 TaxID=2797637 RepID=UPI0018F05D00|nr:QueT transporter family protein [Streptococcus sp. 121]MBJ6745649.1 QueT transporter family protein [Streptococcus sp. 121]
MKSLTTRDWAQMSLVAALYVLLTVLPPFNALSYGAYQLRLSEMLNFFAFLHPKYILSLTVGCMLANFYSFGMIDVFVGGGSTLVFVSIGVYLFKSWVGKGKIFGLFDRGYFAFALFFAISMITIALELHLLQGLPLFLTWFTTAVGEFVSLLLGVVLFQNLEKRLRTFF